MKADGQRETAPLRKESTWKVHCLNLSLNYLEGQIIGVDVAQKLTAISHIIQSKLDDQDAVT